jgi:hypothetical protein
LKTIKTLKKEIEEDTRRWTGLLCSWTGRINTVKMATPLDKIYRFNAILIRTTMSWTPAQSEVRSSGAGGSHGWYESPQS